MPSQIFIFIFLVSIIPPLTYSYELKAVRFEGRCQLWFNNDQGWNPQRVQLFFFYDPAPFLIARNWQTQRKFVFIHPENKQLFQLDQQSINRAKRSCNLEETALEMLLANQTIFGTNSYYGSSWRRGGNSNYGYYRGSWQQQPDTFDESDFGGGQNNGVARFLNPNGTSNGQFYQVWRDKSQSGQCKASLVYERQNDLDNARRNWNQLAYSASVLRSLRTYPLYNCLVGPNGCRSFHVFLVNEDDMTVAEVNIVEQNNYESRWDMIHANQLGRFWTNGSFFSEPRKTHGEYADHCSYAQDFMPLKQQSLGKNDDLIKPLPKTEDEMEEEEENNSSTNQNEGNNEDNGNASSASGRRNGNDVTGNNGSKNGRNNRKGAIVPLNPTPNNNNGRSRPNGNGKVASNKNRNNLTKNDANPVAIPAKFSSESAEWETDQDDENSQNNNVEEENERKNAENDANDGENENNENSEEDDGKIEVNSRNKINISGGGKGSGKFNLDENNSISISGANWGRKGGKRPNISMNRQTNIKMRRRK